MEPLHVHVVDGEGDRAGTSVGGVLVERGLATEADRERVASAVTESGGDATDDGGAATFEGESGRVRLWGGGGWVTLAIEAVADPEPYVTATRFATALAGEEGIDWVVASDDRPGGDPGPATVGPVVAVGGRSLDRLDAEAVTGAPAFAVDQQSGAVGLLVSFGADRPVETLAAYLRAVADPEADAQVDPVRSTRRWTQRLDRGAMLFENDRAQFRESLVETYAETAAEAVDYSDDEAAAEIVVDALTRIADTDSAPGVRATALRGLDAFVYDDRPTSLPEPRGPDPAAMLPLTDPDPEVRAAALEHLQTLCNSSFFEEPFESPPAEATVRALLFGDPDPEVRAAAVSTAATVASIDAVDTEAWYDLVEAVYHTDDAAEPRARAIRRGGADGRLFEAALEGLLSDDDTIREESAAAVSLWQVHGDAAHEYIHQVLREHPDTVAAALASDDDGVRSTMLSILEMLDGDRRVAVLERLDGVETGGVPEFVFETLADGDERVRARTVELLGELADPGDEQAVDVLREALDDESGRVRRDALGALGSLFADRTTPEWLRDAAADRLDDPSSDVRSRAAGIVTSTGGRAAVERLLAALAENEYDDDEKRPRRIVKTLVDVADDCDDDVTVALFDEVLSMDDDVVRGSFAKHCGLYYQDHPAPEAFAEPYVDYLDDPDYGVRKHVIKQLGRAGDPAVVENLLEIVETDDRLDRNALVALGKIAGACEGEVADRIADELVDRLQALEDLNDSMFSTLARAIGHSGHPEAAAALADVVRSVDPGDVRDTRMWYVCRGLGETGCDCALDALLEELADGTHGAAEGLGILGEPAVEPLLDRLADAEGEGEGEGEGDERVEYARALAMTGDPRAFRPALETLVDADEDGTERLVDALEDYADDRLDPVLERY